MSDVTAAVSEPINSAPPSLDDIAAGFEAELNAEDGSAQPQPEQAEPTPQQTKSASLLDVDDDYDENHEIEASSDDAKADSEADQDEPQSDPEDDQDNAESEISFLPGMTEAERTAYAKLTPELRKWVSTREASRQADYTRKTQAIAERNRELDQNVTATLQRINQYDAVLSEFTGQNLQPPPMELEYEDPIAYQDQLSNYIHAKHQQENASLERARIAQEREQLASHQMEQWVAEQANLLVEAEPIFADAKRGPKLRAELLTYAEKQGFQQDQLAALSAKEAMILLKAMRYDNAVARKASDRVPKAKPPKVATPGVSRVGRPTRAVAAVREFDSNPNAGRDDLARLFEAELAAEQR